MCLLSRVIVWALVLASAAGPIANSRAQSTVNADSRLWPFEVGNTWTVQTTANGKTITHVLNVTNVTAGKDSSLATVEYHSGAESQQKETYRFNTQGISRQSSGPNGISKIYPGLPIIQYPLSAHTTWYWNGTITTKGTVVQASAKMTASGPETVKVPAGTFQAFKIHTDLVVAARNVRASDSSDSWYAPGVGLIRQSATNGKVSLDSKLTVYKVQQPAPKP